MPDVYVEPDAVVQADERLGPHISHVLIVPIALPKDYLIIDQPKASTSSAAAI